MKSYGHSSTGRIQADLERSSNGRQALASHLEQVNRKLRQQLLSFRISNVASHDATVYQLKQARITAKKLVQNLLPQFFLRRMKSLIAHQLPKKTDRVVFCPLTETQRIAYELFLDSDMVDLLKRTSQPCDCGSGKQSGWCCYTTLPGTDIKWQVC
jgi:hypothetical protein